MATTFFFILYYNEFEIQYRGYGGIIMLRDVVKIDEEKCVGCGLCTSACQEGALQLIDGKAKLLSDSYCDGLGNCLPNCPVGAISIEKRDVALFDRETAPKHRVEKQEQVKPVEGVGGCPGNRASVIERKTNNLQSKENVVVRESQLGQWPCQIKLVPVDAPYFDNAHLLIAADCTAFAYANIHNDFMKNKITIIGCPKLDNVNYGEKLTEILKAHSFKSITVLRMEKPCCGGIVNAVKEALLHSGNMVPWRAVIIGTDGSIIEE
jgi:ferredoxin